MSASRQPGTRDALAGNRAKTLAGNARPPTERGYATTGLTNRLLPSVVVAQIREQECSYSVDKVRGDSSLLKAKADEQHDDRQVCYGRLRQL